MLTTIDGTQPVRLWHRQNDATSLIPSALIRRFRHRLYSQVVDTAVPVNFAHWYFADSMESAHPLPGDEICDAEGAIWTILEVNLSPLTGIWQAVCETFAFAHPTESVDHMRQDVIVGSLPVRVGTRTAALESEVSERLTFYVRESIVVEWGDVLRRSDGSLWNIVRVDSPMYRARWTAVVTVRKTA